MAGNPLISVIIPIYGVEKYIERCARSLFEQTLDDIEYIFVNDCTKDNSIAVLEKVIEDYPNRKKQITILHHKENKGLPQARKTGIMQAKGEYIAHCDSDDWVDKDMYRAMHDKASKEKADIVFCDYFRTDGLIKRYVKGLRKKQDKIVVINEMIDNLIPHSTWLYISKKQIYFCNPIEYPIAYMGEDYVLTLQLLYYCNGHISYVNKPLYYYWINPKSLLISKDSEIEHKQYLQKIENYNIIYIKYSQTIKSLDARTKLALMPLNKNHTSNQQIWKDLYPHVKWYNIIFSHDIIFRNKIKYLLHLIGLI